MCLGSWSIVEDGRWKSIIEYGLWKNIKEERLWKSIVEDGRRAWKRWGHFDVPAIDIAQIHLVRVVKEKECRSGKW